MKLYKFKRYIKSWISITVALLMVFSVSASQEPAPEIEDPLTEQEISELLLTYKTGDVDMDGEVTVIDSYFILEFTSELRLFSRDEAFLADVTGDGEITPYDALRILEIIAGLYVSPDPIPSTGAYAVNNPSLSPYSVKGIDVSKYQQNIDWEAAQSDGVEFAIIRAGYGKYENQKDAYFERNYAECKRLGIPVGAYHFSYAATVADAIQEANVFLKWIEGKSFEYPVFFDIEHYTNLGVKMTSDIVKTFCTIMEDNGYYVGIYSYSYYLMDYIDYDVLKEYSVWVADISKNAVSFTGTYDMWQYSHTGSVKGISGNVDMNYCYKNYPKIMIEYHLNGF